MNIATRTISASERIVPAQIAHFVVYTPRFKEMVRWYKDVFYMYASHENDQLAFLTYDEEHHRIAIVNIPGLADRAEGHTGVHHVAFTYHTLTEMLLTHERLFKAGITPYWAVNHGPTMSIYYHDPDKNRVEMQIDCFDTAEEGIAYCATPEFAENPVGVDFDPSDHLRRMREGESEAALKVRPYIGARSLEDVPPN